MVQLPHILRPVGTADGTPEAAWITRLVEPLCQQSTGPLAGLRFAVKDNIDVAGLPTTAACPGYTRFPAESAAVVQRLLQAGAALVGKTNLDQFACGLNGTRSPWGAVPNAFDTRTISGGSSSGSAVVVARGEVDFALGTDTAGSGRVPAGFNQVVGLKPSRGLISTRGVVPAAQSVDCVSIFANEVGLAARVLAEAIGYDPLDPGSRTLPLQDRPWAAPFRFGVLSPDDLEADAALRAVYAQGVEHLLALGGRPVPFALEPFGRVADLLYGSALVAERYAAIRAFFDADANQVIEPVRTILAQGQRFSAAELVDAQLAVRTLAQPCQAVWASMDVMLLPTSPAPCTIEAMRADPLEANRRLGRYTNFVNLLDLAALAVPCGAGAGGLPQGVTLVAPAGTDWALAALGQALHQRTGLTLGATGRPQTAAQTIPGLSSAARPASDTVRVAVVGAHLSGMPLNSQLTERGGACVAQTRTAPSYRLYALPGSQPPKPGLIRVGDGQGAAIAVEVWDLPVAHYGSFVALIPAPLGIGRLLLEDGSAVQGFLCEPWALEGAEDITHWGGWRAYRAAAAAQMA